MKRSNKSPAYAGFTLIELLIVLVIMATFTALIVPSMASAMRHRTLAGTGKNIEEMIEFARMSAMARRRPAVLNIDPQRGLCWVSMTDLSLPWLEQIEERPQTRELATIKLLEGVECDLSWGEMSSDETFSETQWHTLTFRSDGTTDDVYIELTKDDEDEPFIISVAGSTGQITVGEMPI